MNMHSYVCCSKDNIQNDSIVKRLSLLSLLADKNRLQILCILSKKEHCVCEIESHIDASQSLISHHLSSLKDEHLVMSKKDGRKMMYALTKKGKIVIQALSLL